MDEGLEKGVNIRGPEAVQEMLRRDPKRETVDPQPSGDQASIFLREICRAVRTHRQ